MATALEVLEDKGGEKTDELVIYEISGGQQEIRRRMKQELDYIQQVNK